MRSSKKLGAAPARVPGAGAKPASVFDQRGQTVAQQINAGRDAIIHQGASPSTAQGLPRVRPEPGSIIASIEREFACNLRDLDRYYVIPDLQDFNPPDELNSPSLIVSRQPAFDVVDEFVARPSLVELGQRCLFVLGDAGMGKTSLLLMLAWRRLAKTPPDGLDCVLLKLGPDTLERIADIPNPARTVLMLDSLDEDPAAHDHAHGAEGRLLELLPCLVRFHRIVLTCRTQFFPETSRHLTTLPGHFVVGSYECPLKYLSLFSDAQVEAYLSQRYRPGRVTRLLRLLMGDQGDEAKLAEARQAAKAMESLRLRPLLLSRIDDFVGSDGRPSVDFGNRYAVYHRLVDQWLMRDAQKYLGMSLEESWRAATLLALHLARQGARMISRDALARIDGLRQIPSFKIEARSLLNRNKDRHYQFAHATIQEFLLAHAILDQSNSFDVRGLQLSREAYRFLAHGTHLLGRNTVDLRGARASFPEVAIEFIRHSFGIELVPLSPGEFLMGSPPGETGRSEDEKQHRVRLTQPFWIGRFPVTQAEFEAVMGENPSAFEDPRRPVESVDWNQAVEFCGRLTDLARAAGCSPEGFEFRLPTEAEWEYACRAGTMSAFNDGSDCTQPDGKDPALERLGWHIKNGDNKTHPVGEKEPNAWGLHDMHGNVWDWCWDGKREYQSEALTDPIGPVTKGARRVVRGGSYWNRAGSCRSACRDASGPGFHGGFLGFRLAAGLPSWRGAPSHAAGGAAAPGPEAPASSPASGVSRAEQRPKEREHEQR